MIGTLPAHGQPIGRRLRPALVVASLLFAFGLHISLGSTTIPLGTVLAALIDFDPKNFNHAIILDLRLPRAIFAVLVGASLSVTGALMQGVTRNPLADPGTLGLLAGASSAVVLAIGVFGIASVAFLPLAAGLGAVAAAAVVWLIARATPAGATPLTLVLSGAAISAFLGALITIANLLDEQSFEQLRVWLTGTLAGRNTGLLPWTLPWMLGGFAIAAATARKITALAMGDEAAAGLGMNVARLKLSILFAVVALTAASVAIAGPMGFVGLVVPHAVRLFVGQDYRRIVPWSAVAGAAYLLLVDIVARIALAPLEISTGLVTALIGAPAFVWLVRARL